MTKQELISKVNFLKAKLDALDLMKAEIKTVKRDLAVLLYGEEKAYFHNDSTALQLIDNARSRLGEMELRGSDDLVNG